MGIPEVDDMKVRYAAAAGRPPIEQARGAATASDGALRLLVVVIVLQVMGARRLTARA